MSTCWTYCLLCYPLRTLRVLQYRRRDQQVCTETFGKACGPGPILSSPCTLPTPFQESESPLLAPDAPSSCLLLFSPFDLLSPLKIPLTAGLLPSPLPCSFWGPQKVGNLLGGLLEGKTAFVMGLPGFLSWKGAWVSGIPWLPLYYHLFIGPCYSLLTTDLVLSCLGGGIDFWFVGDVWQHGGPSLELSVGKAHLPAL